MTNINWFGRSLTERRPICSMARSACEGGFKYYSSELKKLKADAVAYLKSIDQKHWVKYKLQEEFNISTCGKITSSLSEQDNNWMGTELRSAKSLHAFYLYFLKVSELLFEKRQTAANMILRSSVSSLVDVLDGKCKELAEASKKCKFTPYMDGGIQSST
uniref:Uncharacterized protein n=1 Tax=Globisporangium ultimum (strain ATCC 200006 / CBS 805.95 / DAOM BR144) TaxID=431595 RepID=K3WQM0_GLOUD